jgi:3'(2'), 5'-bisphosphate nucleotidase
MLNLNSPEIKYMLDAVRRSAMLVQRVQAELVSASLTKDDRSPVTVADFASQALIGKLLVDAFPNDAMVAEEESSALLDPAAAQTLDDVTHFVSLSIPGADSQKVCAWIDHNRVDTAPRFWTLDPIDGTKGFLRGDQYVVALALIDEGEVQIGALGCPNLLDAHKPNFDGQGSLVIAARGQGAWSTTMSEQGSFTPLHVSVVDEPSRARILRSFESGHTNVSQIDEFALSLGVQVEPVRMDSQAKYAFLAAGAGELILRLLSPSQPDYREKVWDQAAGSLILEQAGGRITDLDGKPLDFTKGRRLEDNRGVLASNGLLHETALRALREIGV